MNITDKVAPQINSEKNNSSNDNEGDEDEDGGENEDEDEEPAEAKLAEEVGSFDEITIWSHESMPLETDDPYLKGVQEWMAFAKAVC